MENKCLIICLIALPIVLILNLNPILAQDSLENSNIIFSTYITGIGCPNCAITDSILLSEYTSKYPNLIIIEYEIYNLRASNQNVVNNYFKSYLPNIKAGVPLIILNKEQIGLGRFQVLDSYKIIENLKYNNFPLPNGTSIELSRIDLTNLEGKIKIWVKDRVLISGNKGNNELLKKLLVAEDISSLLKKIDFEIIESKPIPISNGQIEFSYAIKLDDWILQWNESPTTPKNEEYNNDITPLNKSFWKFWYFIPLFLFFLLFSYFFYKIKNVKKCKKICLTEKQKNGLILIISLLFLIGFFILAKNIPHESLEKWGYNLPLPLFTIFIALIDGFNPCNLFVLTFLLGLLLSASHSRKKIYAIGYTFIFAIFIIYFLFMVAWLNIFKYIGFITPLRIGIACIALIAGFINCKELFAFRKGITLMIQEKHKGSLIKKIEHMKKIIINGSLSALILASIGLAAFASLIELPCTAGFPIIYTGILTGKFLTNSFSYYLYLIFYSAVYVIPLITIITIFGLTLKGKQINKKQMQIIKFIGGLIMILLGLTLLINPSLIGIGFG